MTELVISASSRRRRSSADIGRATLADVSAAAGVSTATVSRVINSPERVSDASRIAVQSAIDRLGYSINGTAQALAAQRSRTLGVIIPSINNLLSASVLDGFQKVLAQSGYEMLLTSFEYDQGLVLRKAENLLRRGVDALFIVSAQHDDTLYDLLEKSRIPFTTTWPPDKRRPVAHVAYDHRAAAGRIVTYLADLGHRDIALITGGGTGNRRLIERHDATRELFSRRGVDLPDDRVIDVGTYDLASARRAFREMQARGPLPTAVIASNDIIGSGVILECLSQGIAVPGDLSVTGFGDLEIAAQLSPALTTIRTPRSQLGEIAANFLLRRLGGQDAIESTELDVELIVRDSAGVPRQERI